MNIQEVENMKMLNDWIEDNNSAFNAFEFYLNEYEEFKELFFGEAGHRHARFVREICDEIRVQLYAQTRDSSIQDLDVEIRQGLWRIPLESNLSFEDYSKYLKSIDFDKDVKENPGIFNYMSEYIHYVVTDSILEYVIKKVNELKDVATSKGMKW